MAPEIFEGRKYNHKVDIWALGILLYEMIHGHSPFRGKAVGEIWKRIKRNKLNFSERTP